MTTRATPPPHLLVADHDEDILALLAALLDQEGYPTHCVTSLEDALALVDEQVFHLVLTDLFAAPPQPRFSAAQRLKQRCYPTPVGILTGWEVTTSEAERLGFAFLLHKPFELEQVLTEIAACLHPPLTPKQEDQAQVIHRFFEVFNARAWDRMPDVCDPDLIYPPHTNLAWGPPQPLIGLDAYLAQVARTLPHFPDFHFEEVTIFGCPQALAVRATTCWTAHDGQLQRHTGGVLFHFVGERIGQMGITLNAERLRRHLAEQAAPPPERRVP
jgi:CheY-like chemotaxis protein